MGGGGAVGGGGATSKPAKPNAQTLKPQTEGDANNQIMPMQKLTHSHLFNLVTQTQIGGDESQREGMGNTQTKTMHTKGTQSDIDEIQATRTAVINNTETHREGEGTGMAQTMAKHTVGTQKNESKGDTGAQGGATQAMLQTGEDIANMQGDISNNNESFIAKVALTPIRVLRSAWGTPQQKGNEQLKERVNAKGSGNEMEEKRGAQ